MNSKFAIWPLTSLLLFSLFAARNSAMSDEAKPEPPDQSDSIPDNTDGTKTLGGRQFWGDVQFFRGWRIQHNVLTKHYRLLDPDDKRFASGSLLHCQEKLSEVRTSRKLPPMSGKAVILIHGIGRSSKSFADMAKRMKKDGYTVVGFDYPSTQVPIPQCADYLHKVIQSLDGIESIDLVGHSMGGLVMRAYQMNHSCNRFRRGVMLGVPNKGAKMADLLKSNPLFKMVLGPAGQQLATDDDGLINNLPTPSYEFGVLAGGRSGPKGYNPILRGDNDMTVTVASTRLPGAADFLLLPVIHSFLMSDERAINATISFLKSAQFDPQRAPSPIRHDDISVIN